MYAREEHRIALSIKALEEKEEEEPVVEETYEVEEESTGFTLGDMIGDDLDGMSE